jgi:hypothetical protein
MRRSSEGPTTADLVSQMNQLNQTISSMIMGGLNQMLASGTAAAAAPERPPRNQEREEHRQRRKHEGGCDCECGGECRECERDDCFCRCCIGDADLVIYARLFELRVIPITLVNQRRREKNIHLELSEFKTRGGETLGVKAILVPPVDFVLPPCGEEKIIIAVETFPAGDNQAGTGISSARFQTSAAARELPDVDECRVLYADLRVEGCDIRPIRIALALLPRDCDEYEIDCGCSCC